MEFIVRRAFGNNVELGISETFDVSTRASSEKFWFALTPAEARKLGEELQNIVDKEALSPQEYKPKSKSAEPLPERTYQIFMSMPANKNVELILFDPFEQRYIPAFITETGRLEVTL